MFSYYRAIKASFNRALLENWICKRKPRYLDQGTWHSEWNNNKIPNKTNNQKKKNPKKTPPNSKILEDICGSVILATFGNGPEVNFKWDYESVMGQQEGWLKDQSLVQMAFSSW